jgi:hypothetical protein
MLHLSDIPLFKLLKTGQTTQYGGYNDDGLYEMGIAKAYTVLTLGVYSGHTHIILNAIDEAHDNACVYDRRTQLMWSRYLPHHVGPNVNGSLPWTTNVNGEGIFAYVAAANAALLAGYGDWRVCNMTEMLSLFDIEAPNAYPDVVAFPNHQVDLQYWTSTTRPDTVTNAFWVQHVYPYTYFDLKTLNTFFLMLVRGG